MKKIASLVALAAMTVSGVASATAVDSVVVQGTCAGLPNEATLLAALDAATAGAGGGGLDFDMWATVVNHNGEVCQVVANDANGNGAVDPWMASRVISAQKANTANSLSTEDLALSTANLYAAVSPRGSLYGLQHSNPVDVAAYAGDPLAFGTGALDPMAVASLMVGGVNVFGGGLALYDNTGALIGAVGVSGDFSCADHNIAWAVRDELALDFVPGGVSKTGDDNMVNDIKVSRMGKAGGSKGGWGHPTCSNALKEQTKLLPTTFPLSVLP